MSELELALFGAPTVRQHGQVVSFATRKVLALLVYLVVEGGWHSREKIATWFWPESDDEHGRAVLRRTLALLRQALPNADRYLFIERDRLAFNPESDTYLDLHVLDAAWRAGPAREALAPLQAAVKAYRGDFLEGFSPDGAPAFDDWASLQREYWHRRMGAVFDWLSQLHAEAGETGPAIDAAAAWVAHDQLDEAAHRRLMMCFFIAGNRTSALQAYETCRKLLRAELGVEPALETEALAERLAAEAAPRHPLSDKPSSEPAPAVLPPVLESPLVGRAEPFARFVEAYHAAARGQPRVVTLEGEAGIGKTRLALECLAWAKAQGAKVLQGRAFEAGDRVPYQTIVEALRDLPLSRPESGDPAFSLSPVWLSELSRLLPELRGIMPELEPAPARDDAAARARLLEAIARFTQALATQPSATQPTAAPSPLIVFVDDAHWADLASLDALAHMVRFWTQHGTPGLLLLTVRHEPGGPLATEWLPALQREAQTSRLALHALTAEETLQLVRRMAAQPPSAELETFGRWLFAETGGQPFFISETLKTLVERRVLLMQPARGGKWGVDFRAAGPEARWAGAAHLPQGVQALLRARLTRLTPPAAALLLAGAVLRRDFQFETACAIAGLQEDEGLAALDELRYSYLLREGAGDSLPEGLSIAHDRIREVVYADGGEARRRVFHRRALEALEKEAVPAGERAYHAIAAGMVEPALRLSLTAAEDALAVFAVRNAIEYYEQARTLAASLALPASKVQNLYLQLGRACELVVDFGHARAVYEQLLSSTRQAGDASAECAALNRLATLDAQAALDFDSALAHLDEALRVAARSGDRASLAETEWNLSQVGYYAGDARSVVHGEQAVALARSLDRPELLARSLNTLAWAKADLAGEWSQARAHAEEARALYVALGNRAMEADSLCLLANAQLYTGRAPAALAVARAAQAISLEIENPWGEAHTAFQVAKCALDAGAYGEALQQVHQAVLLAQAHDLPLLTLLSFALEGAVQRALGMIAEAIETHRQAEAILAGAPEWGQPLAAMISTELIADYASTGDWTVACAAALRLKPLKLDRAMPFNLLVSLPLLVETFLRAGEVMASTAFMQELCQRGCAYPRPRISYLQGMAILAGWQGETRQAAGYLEEAAALAEAGDFLGELWQIDAARGKLYAALDDRALEQAANARAAEIIRKIADQLGDERQREAFEATDAVRTLLDGRFDQHGRAARNRRRS